MKSFIYDKEKWIFLILFIFLLIKISIFKFIPLLNDEAYALTISKQLSKEQSERSDTAQVTEITKNETPIIIAEKKIENQHSIIPVPQEVVGIIIGKGGETIK